MHSKLKDLGYSERFIKSLNNQEKDFLVNNNDILPNIKKSIISIYPVPEDKILKVILTSFRMGNDADKDTIYFKVNDIIKSEIRNKKLNTIISESIISFREFILIY